MKNKNLPILILGSILILGTIALVYFIVTKQQNPAVLAKDTIRVTTTLWSGWGKGFSDSKIKTFDLSENKVLDLQYMSDESVKVISYNDEEVTFTAEHLGLKIGDEILTDTIDLDGCGTQNFTVKKGSRVELYTCTMDAGTFYLIEY